MAEDDKSKPGSEDDTPSGEERRINPADRRATERVGVSMDRRKRSDGSGAE